MTCAVCQRDEKRMNSEVAECSHVECPHRRRLTAMSRRDASAEIDAARAFERSLERLFDNPFEP